MIVPILSLLVVLAVTVDLPFCQNNKFYNIVPLVPSQAYYLPLYSLIWGYNLEYRIQASSLVSKYIKVGDKLKKIREEGPNTDVPLSGLKSYHMDKIGNSWGQRFIALGEKGSATYVHYGVLNSNTSVPVISNFIKVENNTNITCFDAVLLSRQNYIVVDCVQTKEDSQTKRPLKNIFYYFRINDAEQDGMVETQMFIGYKNIVNRKLQIYNDAFTKNTLVLRSYMSTDQPDNSYLEILNMENPKEPWVLAIIDRSFLNVKKLKISDFRLYLGVIYILDQSKGVYRVKIKGSQDLQYQGLYEARGFNKINLFSASLDNHVQLVIGNNNAVYEIDWTYIQQPRLLNKYSLKPGSKLLQVFLNSRFVVVRSQEQNNYNYTWIMTRGDRTYARAFKVIKNGTSPFLVDFNEQLSYLLIVDQQTIANYKIDQPSLLLDFPDDQYLKDNVFNFTLIATSVDPETKNVISQCKMVINMTLLDPNNRTMWVVGSGPPSQLSANWPGQVRLQLGDYILGPNITYRIRETEKGTIKKSKVYQQDQLNVVWQEPIPFQNVTFLRTQTVNDALLDSLTIYTQTNDNQTYVSTCSLSREEMEARCKSKPPQDFGGRIVNWATSMLTIDDSLHHIITYTIDVAYNQLYLQDITSNSSLQVEIGRGFPGNISSVTSAGKYLFVVLHHIKRVNIYDLNDCLEDMCEASCNLNHMSMYNMGVKFFSPRSVHASVFHPNLLFVRAADAIFVIDLSKECVPVLLAQLQPVEDPFIDYSFEVNSNYLIVAIAALNVVQEYDISRIWLRQIRKTKQYPLYGYKLPKNYEFDISDYGNCVYLSTMTEGGDYNIFVYRSGLPAVGSLYSQINLYAYQHVLLDASGQQVDYISVITGKEMKLFRQYERPLALIDNPEKDYTFYLQYFNTLDSARLQLIGVKIINLPTYIKVSPFLNNIMNTKDLLFSGENRVNEINDTDWYQGNVLYFNTTCRDCGTRVKIDNHVEAAPTLRLVPKLTAYQDWPRPHALGLDAMIELNRNGSVGHVVGLGGGCKQVTVSRFSYSVAACLSDGLVYLQVVNEMSTKPFALQRMETTAENVVRLQAVHNLVMLFDGESQVYFKRRGGAIYLFQLSQELETDQPLNELQVIEGNDFGLRDIGELFFNNAELIYDGERNRYRLYVSQATRGILMMEFTHELGDAHIVVTKTSLVQPRPLLDALNEPLPYDATFQAISWVSTTVEGLKVVDRIIVTTGRFHTFQLSLVLQGGSVSGIAIERIYLRYSYYQVSNEIRHHQGLFVVRQSLPNHYKDTNMTRQLYTVYSIDGKFNGSVQRRGLIGALPLMQDALHKFDFNFTVQPDDPLSQPRIGLVVVEENSQVLKRASLHKNLSLVTTELLDTQIIYIDLINDFNHEKIRILLNGISPFPEWKMILIIVFSIIGFALLVIVAVFVVKRVKAQNVEERQTLITQDQFG